MNSEIDHYRNLLKAMATELQARFGIIEMGLFGSRLRGDHRPNSDLDVLVQFAPNARVSLLTLSDLEETLRSRLGLAVDVVLKDTLKPYIGRRILAEVQYL